MAKRSCLKVPNRSGSAFAVAEAFALLPAESAGEPVSEAISRAVAKRGAAAAIDGTRCAVGRSKVAQVVHKSVISLSGMLFAVSRGMTTPQSRYRAATITLFAALVASGCNNKTTVFEGDPEGANCETFADEQSESTVTLRFTNSGTEPIFLGNTMGCTEAVDFGLSGPGGEPLLVLESSCLFTCEELQTSSANCAAGCIQPPVYMLMPGGSYDFAWQGTIFSQTTMPSACYFEDYGNESCLQERVAEPGDYQVRVRSWGEAEGCGYQSDAEDCECADASEQCTLPPGAQLTGTPSETVHTFTLGQESVVVVEIGEVG